MSLQFYDNNSFKNDFIYSKELYSLINYKISNDLRNYKLVSFDDNRLLINPNTLDWAIHIRNDRGFWNKTVLGSTFEHFSINEDDIQKFIVLRWFSVILKNELNETCNDKLLFEDSFSNRTMLVNQIMNYNIPKEIFSSESKYLTKTYWFSIPNFNKLNDTNFFTFI